MLITIRDLSVHVHVNVKLSMSLFNVMGVRKMSLARNCPRKCSGAYESAQFLGNHQHEHYTQVSNGNF